MSITCESELFKQLSEGSDQICLESDVYISDDFKTIGEFSGILDGQDHTIYNLNSSLITEITKEGVVKNINFKILDFDTRTAGVFHKNFGTVNSISVSGTENGLGATMIVKENSGCIENCAVSGLYVNIGTSFGSICDENTGYIENCTVADSFIKGKDNIGGICSRNKTGIIKNCNVRNADLVSENATGGIIGVSEGGSVRNCSVIESDIESDFIGTGGIIARIFSQEVSIYNCSVEETTLIGYRNVNVVSDDLFDSSGSVLVDSCSIRNCSVTVIDPDVSNVNLFPEKVRECYIIDTVVKADVSFNKIEEITNSYVDIELVSSSSVELFEDSESFYISIDRKEISNSSNTIKVSKVEDFAEIGRFDTVELCADIDLSEGKIESISVFEGVFKGNGHTLLNLTKPLFKQCNGTVQNLNINEFCITNYSRSGCITKYGFGSTFKNIKIKKDNSNLNEKWVYGLAYKLEKSTVSGFHCSIDTDARSVHSLVNEIESSVVRDSEIEVDLVVRDSGCGLAKSAIDSELIDINVTGEICIDRNKNKLTEVAGVCTLVEKARNCSSDIDITHKEPICSITRVSGLFGQGEVIKNCKFTGKIDFENINENLIVGGIVSICNQTVSNCTNKGDIIYSGDNQPVGGIVARNNGGIIKNCRNTGSIKGADIVGGIVGRLMNGAELSNSINTGEVLGDDKCGGLVGYIRGTSNQVLNCYNHCQKVDSNDVLIGSVDHKDKNTFANLFYIPIDDTQSSNYGKETHEDSETLNVILF